MIRLALNKTLSQICTVSINTVNTNYASLKTWTYNLVYLQWNGVNHEKQDWTYQISCTKTLYGEDYVSGSGVGKNVNVNKQNAIKSVIKSVDDTFSTCYCQDIDKIQVNLQNYDGQYWNVLCSGEGTISALLNDYSHQYILTEPSTFKCRYLVYATLK